MCIAEWTTMQRMYLSCCAVKGVGAWWQLTSCSTFRASPFANTDVYFRTLAKSFLGYALALLRRTVVQRCRTYGMRVRSGTRNEAFFPLLTCNCRHIFVWKQKLCQMTSKTDICLYRCGVDWTFICPFAIRTVQLLYVVICVATCNALFVRIRLNAFCFLN